MGSTISIAGLISGIDTHAALEQLRQVARAPLRRLEARKETLSLRSVAWSELEAKLLDLRTVASQLSAPATFAAKTASSTHPHLVSATAAASASPGTYFFTVQSLARTHQLASQGYADVDQTPVGSGALSLSVGGGQQALIAVDGLTLSELRDAINAADAGVTASLISDGSGQAPYRLILTSGTSGLAGAVAVGAPEGLAFSELQAAQDAQIRLGSGEGAITISSSTNTITGAIEGVTLKLLEADPAAAVTLTVARDTARIEQRISDLVGRYNAIVDFLAEQFHYDPKTNHTGTLFGDYDLQSLQQRLAGAVAGRVWGLERGYRALAELGITTGASGRLVANAPAVAAALAADHAAVERLFAARGETTDPAVSFLAATSQTQPSGAPGWAVEITQAARQARVTAGVAQAGPLASDETLTIQGVQIRLTVGMTQAEVIAAINARQSETGVLASATGADGEGAGKHLTLTRVTYGSAYGVTAVSSASNQGGGATSGLGNVTVTDKDPAGESGAGVGAAGLDVQGAIGGQPCTGAGRRLTATAGDPKGLTLLVSAEGPGGYGAVVFTVGVAEAAFRAALSATDLSDGVIARVQNRIADTIDGVDREIARLGALIEREQERLRAAFARMEQALGRFQTQSLFLESQFAQMRANAAASARR